MMKDTLRTPRQISALVVTLSMLHLPVIFAQIPGLYFPSWLHDNVNLRPIIGILDQPTSESVSGQTTYIPASYVKWVESSGARAVPVPYSASEQTLTAMFSALNGIIFTGGGLDLSMDSQYFQAADFLYNLALESYTKGDYFPIWGTCQGFQLLSIITSQNESVDQRYAFHSENLPLPLWFTDGALKSRMFGSASAEVYNTFANENVTINLHHDGVAPEEFFHNPRLAQFYNLLSFNADRNEKLFASAFESKTAPIYGVQFHPERNQFEWDWEELVSHSPTAISAMQYLGDFFVNEARKNLHKMPNKATEVKALIYQYSPTFTGADTHESYPEQQTYYFDDLQADMEALFGRR